MPPANGEEKQLLNKDKKPDEASLASEISASANDKKEENENLSSDPPALPDQEERGPIKDRSCTDVICLGRAF